MTEWIEIICEKKLSLVNSKFVHCLTRTLTSKWCVNLSKNNYTLNIIKHFNFIKLVNGVRQKNNFRKFLKLRKGIQSARLLWILWWRLITKHLMIGKAFDSLTNEKFIYKTIIRMKHKIILAYNFCFRKSQIKLQKWNFCPFWTTIAYILILL